jgi:hypothetical protein
VKLVSWLERTPWWLIVVAAVVLALTPLGESHLAQKWRMLFAGTLRRPLDWFDLVFHTAPLLLLLAKVVLLLRRQ